MLDNTSEVDPNAAPPVINEAPPENVVLTADQYDSLLDQLAEMETALQLKGTAPAAAPITKDDLASLVNTAKGSNEDGTFTTEELNKLSPAQLVSFIIAGVQENIAQPLLVKIEEQRIKSEIKDFIREEKIEDFWSYQDQIFKLSTENPRLSIPQAYYLAKQAVPGKPNTETKPNATKLPLNLPPRSRQRPAGERPIVDSSTTVIKTPETRMDAAKEALAEMKRNGTF